MKLDLLTSLSVNSRFIQPIDVYIHVSSIKTVNTFLGLKLMTVASFSQSLLGNPKPRWVPSQPFHSSAVEALARAVPGNALGCSAYLVL